MKGATLFNPSNLQDVMFYDLPHRAFSPDPDLAENELRKLKVMDRTKLELESDVVTIKFWAQVYEFQIEDEKIFKNIATYALKVLSLPVSNSYVERVFSIVSFMKDKVCQQNGASHDGSPMAVENTSAGTCINLIQSKS